jgi:hypothetical protein
MIVDPQELLEAIREQARKTGRLGGLTRAKNMTAEQRRKSALKASKAAARARSEAARLKEIGETVAAGAKSLKKLVETNARARKAREKTNRRNNS